MTELQALFAARKLSAWAGSALFVLFVVFVLTGSAWALLTAIGSLLSWLGFGALTSEIDERMPSSSGDES